MKEENNGSCQTTPTNPNRATMLRKDLRMCLGLRLLATDQNICIESRYIQQSTMSIFNIELQSVDLFIMIRINFQKFDIHVEIELCIGLNQCS